MPACTSCDTYSLTTCYGCQDVNNAGTITHYYKYIGASICGTGCPLGQYIDDTNSPNACLMCDANCVACFGTSTNCTQASGCKVNNFFNNATNSCVSVCPNGTFGNVVTKFCENCASGCALCYGPALTQCTKCMAVSSTNYYLKLNLDQCSTSCNSNEYGDSTFFKCFLCNPACATCSSSTTCATCTSVNGAAYFLNGTMCSVSCPSGQYGSLTNYQCTNCANECATCFGGLNTQCYTCKAVTSTNYFLVYSTNYCSSSCPNGQYANTTDFTCKLCNPECLTCVTTPGNCLTCGFSSQGYNLFLQTNKCLMNCLNGYWGNPSTNNCDACAVGCATCSAAGTSACTVCNTDTSTSTMYYKWIGSTVCATTCPNGQFISASISYLCQPCSSICVTCSVTAENCTASTCAANYFYLNNNCLGACPNHYYADSALRQCLACATGCSTCFAAGTSSCTVCSTSYYLQTGQTSCAATCASGEFANAVGNVCTACVAACATCTAATVCQSCQSVNGIAYFLSGSACTVACPSNQFGQVSNFRCTACADGCATCFGAALSACSSCGVSSAPANYYLVYATTTCAPSCPNGQYANATAFQCMLCSSNCLTCVTTSTNCLTCGFSTAGANLYLFGSSCLLTCPNGYFANSATFTCDACHFGCATCSGSSLTSCTVCTDYNNAGTIIPYYKVLGSTTCAPTCPTGQFISSSPNACAWRWSFPSTNAPWHVRLDPSTTSSRPRQLSGM